MMVSQKLVEISGLQMTQNERLKILGLNDLFPKS
jgi:hypothetical protein